MLKIIKYTTSLILLSLAFVNATLGFETKAGYAILVDYATGHVLYEKNADTQMAPSSMSKLMTTYVVFERLKQGSLSLDDTFVVSEKAWRKKGSKMFVRVGNHVSVRDLLLGVIVQSGNDACITLAEGIAGSEEAFAQIMNNKALELGLKNSHFKNATGWPEEGHVMSARDLSILSSHLLNEFPEYYHFFSVQDFVYNDIKQQNRNMLLNRKIGVDGLKTGHADDAGYGIAASAIQNGRRLILVINGLSGTVERANEAEHLLQYGMLNFTNLKVVQKGQVLENAKVWMGRSKFIPITAKEDIIVTVPREIANKVKVTLEYAHPIEAPVHAGDPVAELIIDIPGQEKKFYPIMAVAEVKQLPLLSRIIANAKYQLLGKK